MLNNRVWNKAIWDVDTLWMQERDRNIIATFLWGFGAVLILLRWSRVEPFYHLEMYHNVQYLHLVSPPFAVPSVCSIVLLQCLVLVDSLCILLSADVCVTSVKWESGCVWSETKPTESFPVPPFPFCPCGLPKFERVCETHVSWLRVCTVCRVCVLRMLNVHLVFKCMTVLGFVCVCDTSVCVCVCA